MFGEKRFVRVMWENIRQGDTMIIYVDTKTGVQYLFAWPGGDASGMVVLVDADGKPLLHESYKKE